MKILFISFGDNYSNIFTNSLDKKNNYLFNFLQRYSFFEIPLTIPILISLTPKEHTIDVLELNNKNYKNIDYSKKYDLVGITTITQHAFISYEIADEFRKRGCKVVIGGWHPSALPEEAKMHADSVVIGEADEIWANLLKDAEKNQLKTFYKPEKPVDPINIPILRPEIFTKGTNISVQATRGCPNQCQFCAITHMKNRKIFRKRPIHEVVEEIKSIPNKTFVFQDNSMTIDVGYTKRLFKELKNVNKRFVCRGNQSILEKDDELLKLASEAGCIDWFIGLESISSESLKEMHKESNKANNYIKTIKKIHDYGMGVRASFIFGFDHDTLDIFHKTNEFIRKSEIDVPSCGILTPFPGTPIYNRLEKEGRILTKDWSLYNMENVVYQPMHMTAEELAYNSVEIQRKWYTTFFIFKRIMHSIGYGFYPFLFVIRRNLFFYRYNMKLKSQNIKNNIKKCN